jgi:hypothetical protein
MNESFYIGKSLPISQAGDGWVSKLNLNQTHVINLGKPNQTEPLDFTSDPNQTKATSGLHLN